MKVLDYLEMAASKEINGVMEIVPRLCSSTLGNKECVTNICASRDAQPTVAVALSKRIIKVQTLSDNLYGDFELPEFDSVVEMKFDQSNNNLLWVACIGTICLWDLRTPSKSVSSFTDTSDEAKNKNFNCFDVSSCGRLLCAGTDKYEEDSFILFWDIRKSSLAGGFWESHEDDITQVKFHPKESSKLFSASTDGLINVYDLNQSSEDDALVDTLNTESSIEKITFTEFQSKNLISCITHTEDVQFWVEDGVQPYLSLKRDQLGKIAKIASAEDLYIIDAHQMNRSNFVLTGCDSSDVIGLTLEGSSLMPSFRLLENKQPLKCSCYNDNIKVLLTGGEDGVVDAWKLQN